MPADGRWIKKNVRALQGSQPRAFRIPLVPAHQRSHAAVLGIKGLETKVAGSEVKLLIVKRIVRDVHFAIDAFEASIGFQYGCGVVIEAGRAALKDRYHDHNVAIAGNRGQCLRGWSGDRFGQVEERMVFTLAKILRAK